MEMHVWIMICNLGIQVCETVREDLLDMTWMTCARPGPNQQSHQLALSQNISLRFGPGFSHLSSPPPVVCSLLGLSYTLTIDKKASCATPKRDTEHVIVWNLARGANPKLFWNCFETALSANEKRSNRRCSSAAELGGKRYDEPLTACFVCVARFVCRFFWFEPSVMLA